VAKIDFVTFPSFRQDRSCVQLADFLSKLPDDDWVWSVLEFYGVGTAPNGLPMADFEALTRSEPKGFIMNWSELKNFAGSLDQTYDCLIVAARSVQDISNDKSSKENFSNCEVVIEAFDSTEWSVWARDKKLMQELISAF